MQSRRSLRRSAHQGLSFVETAIMLVILGLMIEFVIKGRELVQNARVRDMISQQGAAESAFLAFQDRFRAPPGDYPAADVNLSCGSFICLNGNGNGRVEPAARQPPARPDQRIAEHLPHRRAGDARLDGPRRLYRPVQRQQVRLARKPRISLERESDDVCQCLDRI